MSKEKARGPLSPEQQEMVLQWMPLYHKIVGERRVPRDTDGQIIRDRMLAVLVKACYDFDPEVWPNPYCIIYKSLDRLARRELKALWKRRRTRGKMVQMSDDGMTGSVSELLDSEFVEREKVKDVAELVRAAIDALPSEEWKGRVRLYFGIDVPARMDGARIARRQGVTRNAVHQTLGKAIRFMKKWIEDNQTCVSI